MASFFTPEFGENGVDRITNYVLQQRAQKALEQRQSDAQDARESLLNQKANQYILNKAFDATNYDTDAIHQQQLSDILNQGKQAGVQYLAQNKNADQYDFQNAMLPFTTKATNYVNGVNSVNARMGAMSDVYKGSKVVNPAAYKNAFIKTALYNTDGTLKDAKDVDLDAAHAYLEKNPQLYVENPENSLKENFVDKNKGGIASVDGDTVKDATTGASTTHTFKFQSLPYAELPQKGSTDMRMKVKSEPYRNDEGKPDYNRKLLPVEYLNGMMDDDNKIKPLIALANKKFGNDFKGYGTTEGQKQLQEVAYTYLDKHAPLGFAESSSETKGDPNRPILEMQKIAANNQTAILKALSITKKENPTGKDAAIDNYHSVWDKVTKNDPDTNTQPSVKIQFPNAKTAYDATPIGSLFKDGKYAIGIDKTEKIKDERKIADEGDTVKNPNYNKPIYADEIYKTTSNGIIVKQGNNYQVYNTPERIDAFINKTAALNGSSVTKQKTTLGDKVKSALGIKPKQNTLPAGQVR